MPEVLHDFQFLPPKHWKKAREDELRRTRGIYSEDLGASRKISTGSPAGLIGILEDRIDEIGWQIENPPKPTLKKDLKDANPESAPKV